MLRGDLQVPPVDPAQVRCLQTEASGGCWDSLRSEAGEEAALPGSPEKSPRSDAPSHQPAAGHSELVVTAGTRVHSCLLSSFPDASPSGHCSPQALLFYPMHSEALSGVSVFLP